MRKSRYALVAALACGTVLGTSSLAFADGAADNISSIEAGVSPNYQSSTKAGPATLFSQVQTFDADGGPFTIVDKAAERVTLDFDDDIKILDGKAATKFDECGGQGGNDLNAFTTAQAARECRDAVVGSGQAVALVPAAPPAPPVVPVELTITTINGPETVPGGTCTTPGENQGGPEGCEYVGGNPQIILHAYNQTLAFITTVGGEVRDSVNSDADEDYGKALIVNDAPDTAGDAGSLILFNSTVGKEITQIKVKKDGTKNEVTKVKDYNYVTATCGNDGANGGLEYDFRGHWVYDDNTTDVDTFKQKCSNETVPDPVP